MFMAVVKSFVPSRRSMFGKPVVFVAVGHGVVAADAIPAKAIAEADITKSFFRKSIYISL